MNISLHQNNDFVCSKYALLSSVILCMTNLLSFSQTNHCTIIPYLGVNNIHVNQSSLRDVKKEFGRKKVQRQWHKSIEIDIIGKFELFRTYEEFGYFSTTPRRGFSRKIKRIKLDTDCQCQTVEGIGIGSTLQELFSIFGSVEVSHWKFDWRDDYKEASYRNMHFRFSDTKSENPTVSEINIYGR